MDIVLAPDVYVNASIALGSPPDKVVQRVLGENKGKSKATEWILGRVAAMLTATGSFKADAVGQQIDLIRNLVQVVPADEKPQDDWEGALVEAAKAAKAKRVITDHPDLLAKEQAQGIEFISSEVWLLERKMPPPPPPPRPR